MSEEDQERINQVKYFEELFHCRKCALFLVAALESGKAAGMCQECFEKRYVHVKLDYEVKGSRYT